MTFNWSSWKLSKIEVESEPDDYQAHEFVYDFNHYPEELPEEREREIEQMRQFKADLWGFSLVHVVAKLDRHSPEGFWDGKTVESSYFSITWPYDSAEYDSKIAECLKDLWPELLKLGIKLDDFLDACDWAGVDFDYQELESELALPESQEENYANEN